MGGMKVYTRKIENDSVSEEEMEETTFLYLTCDLPPTPLFKNELMENIIPQVCIELPSYHEVYTVHFLINYVILEFCR